jgi:hypothetical protein
VTIATTKMLWHDPLIRERVITVLIPAFACWAEQITAQAKKCSPVSSGHAEVVLGSAYASTEAVALGRCHD